MGASPYTLDMSGCLGENLGSGHDTETFKGTITIKRCRETSAWAMMIFGFGRVGYMVYRRRQVGETVAAADVQNDSRL